MSYWRRFPLSIEGMCRGFFTAEGEVGSQTELRYTDLAPTPRPLVMINNESSASVQGEKPRLALLLSVVNEFRSTFQLVVGLVR